ncbi:MAG: phosphate ABC transporter permease PstA [Planctomycetaceae bacterium]|nr:phosphate ABC transporter permease PstA [Planctomycetaceae bacterium]
MSNTSAATELLSGSRQRGRWFEYACWLATWSAMAILVTLLFVILWQGLTYVNWHFLSRYEDKLQPERSGILPGLWGSFWLMLLTCAFSIPVGVGAAVYLEEYSNDNWLTRLIKLNLSNLAGVPSIVYGILGLTVFVRMFDIFAHQKLVVQGPLGMYMPLPFGETIVSGALTLSLLSLPVIIVATQEALRAVPQSLRHASIALGATRWQTVSRQVLPAALPGIMTGVILSISRAIGETAPLIVVGCATFIQECPPGVDSPVELLQSPEMIFQIPFSTYTSLPNTIYGWSSDARPVVAHKIAAGIIVLLVVLMAINGLAIYIRNRAQKHLNW